MKRSAIILLLLIACACELIVDVDVPFDGYKLTVNSVFNTDSLWSATVFLNRHILERDEAPYKRIENATVIISDENGPVDTLRHTQEGRYVSDTGKPVAGKNYHIRVSAPDYPAVESESMAPTLTPITQIDLKMIENNNERYTLLKLKFTDDGAKNNYYHILAWVEYEYFDVQSQESFRNGYSLQIENENPDLNPQNIEVGSGIMVKDVFFNGKETELSLRLNVHDISNYPRMRITLLTASEDYYNYQTTLDLQRQTTGDPFAQPVNVYNNIQNGFGIFAGVSQSVFIKESPKPVITAMTPSAGRPGDEVLIDVENFPFDEHGYRQVLFRGVQYPVQAEILQISTTQLKIRVPANATTGKIVINAGSRTIVSDTPFEILD